MPGGTGAVEVAARQGDVIVVAAPPEVVRGAPAWIDRVEPDRPARVAGSEEDRADQR